MVSVRSEPTRAVPTPAWTLSPALVPFVLVGTVAVIAGGLAAAISRPAGWSDGSWVAAYLVLVTGVGQIGLAAGQAALTTRPAPRRVAAQVLFGNGGSVLIIAGTLVSVPLIVSIGGVALMVALVLFATTQRTGDSPQWVRWCYTSLLVVLIPSIPIGLVLAWMRA